MDFWSLYWTFSSFVFGATVGSFLNVCIWRLPRGESLSDPPSHCPSCRHRLRFLPDMVPILSQLWYRSRCRYCGAPFSWRYLWVELLTAVVFAAICIRYTFFAPAEFGETERVWTAVITMLFAASLITIFFIDLEHYIIPDLTVLVALLLAIAKDVFLIARGLRSLWVAIPGVPWQIPVPLSIIGGLIAFWLLWQFAALCSAALGKEAMGAGDSLLLGAMGAFLLPWPLLLIAFLIAVALGTVGGLVGIALTSRTPAPSAATAAAVDSGEVEPEPVAAGPLDGEAPPQTVSAEAMSTSDTSALESEAAPAPESPESGGGQPEDEEPEVPALPPASRWGRLRTVAGTWVAVGALWAAAAFYRSGPVPALVGGAVGLAVAAVLIVGGVRQWVAGDREWLPAMDGLFEEDPGPRFIPFGPYLVAGSLAATLFGRAIAEWYAISQLGLRPEALAGMGWD